MGPPSSPRRGAHRRIRVDAMNVLRILRAVFVGAIPTVIVAAQVALVL